MDLKHIALAVALSAGATVICGPAQAESSKAGTLPRHIKAIDADHDGTIELNEAKKAAVAHFKRLDRDKDNTLDRREMSLLGIGKKAFAKADPDNDRTLDEGEYLALVEQQFKAADPDKDGTLSFAEMKTKAGKALMRLIAK